MPLADFFPPRFRLGRLAHNTVLATFWQFGRVGGQALWVIVIARSLGPSGYGVFAGTAGLAVALGGLAGLGTGYLLLQAVSRDRESFGAYWRKALLTSLASGLILAAIFTAIASLVLGHAAGPEIIVVIAFSELVCYPLVYASAFAFQAHEKLGWSSALTTWMAAARLLAAILFWATDASQGLTGYIWFHLGASLLTALAAITLVQRMLRPQSTRFTLTPGEVKEGLSFSAVWFTSNAAAELDKTLALKLMGSEVAGLYAAAYRLASALTVPVISLSLAAQPRMFRHAANPSEGNPRLVQHLVVVTLIYSVAASVALFFLAGILPWLLGPAFAHSVPAARMLVLLPPLYSLRAIGNTVLMTNGRQLVRALTECAGIAALIVFALIWMPRYGLTGAVMAVIATEALLASLVWAVVWKTQRK